MDLLGLVKDFLATRFVFSRGSSSELLSLLVIVLTSLLLSRLHFFVSNSLIKVVKPVAVLLQLFELLYLISLSLRFSHLQFSTLVARKLLPRCTVFVSHWSHGFCSLNDKLSFTLNVFRYSFCFWISLLIFDKLFSSSDNLKQMWTKI